jgi:hypothetical protein
LTALTITGTSGNDYISLAGSGNSLIQVDVNSVITNYNPFDYTSVVIQGGMTSSTSSAPNCLPRSSVPGRTP